MLRLFLYHTGIFKTKRLDCKVVSIGNITVGGSGKTPMTVYLARRFLEKGKRVVILSRGYKGAIKDIGVVSDGSEIILGPEDAGDEPYLIALKLKHVPVVVGRDRYRAGLYAIERFKPDVIILDDGFQHIGLHRDTDILLVDSRRGFGNGYLFPLGMLREPIHGLKRASLVMIKGDKIRAPEPEIRNYSGCPVIIFNYKPEAISYLLDDTRLERDALKGMRVLAVSGIADPSSFRDTLEGLGANIVKEICYPDHHMYTLSDLEDIAGQSTDIEMVVVTEKDAVKLRRVQIKDLPIYAVEIDVQLEDSDVFDEVVGLKNV